MTADKKVRMHLLYDFYGQLLTDKQRSFFELYHHDDLSLGEIAEQHGVSRQAVYDILKRAERTLEDLESKLALVARWQREHRLIAELDQELSALAEDVARLLDGPETGSEDAAGRIRQQIRTVRERLRTLAGEER